MMRFLHGCAAVGGATAVVALGAWAGTAGRSTEELADRGRSQGEIPIGEALEVNGQPMQLSVFYTEDAPERVAQFYADAFRARRVMPIVAAERGIAHVSGFEPRDGLQRFVNALPQPDGMTLVMVGVVDPRRPLRLSQRAADSDIPVPLEHRAFLSHRARDQGVAAETAQFVSSWGPSEVLAFYRRELGARGFLDRTRESSSTVAVFAKGVAMISVAVQPLSEQNGSAVFVTQTAGATR